MVHRIRFEDLTIAQLNPQEYGALFNKSMADIKDYLSQMNLDDGAYHQMMEVPSAQWEYFKGTREDFGEVAWFAEYLNGICGGVGDLAEHPGYENPSRTSSKAEDVEQAYYECRGLLTEQMRLDAYGKIFPSNDPIARVIPESIVALREADKGREAAVNPRKEPGAYTLNGSTFTFGSFGKATRVYYEHPRDGLKPYGVRDGSRYFTGYRQGNSFFGQIRYKNQYCQTILEPARADLSEDGTKITFYSKIPTVDAKCLLIKLEDDAPATLTYRAP